MATDLELVRHPAAAGTTGAAAPSEPASRRRWVLLWHAGWIAGLAAGLTLAVERFGFNPTDQGFVLAQSWRILHGEVPHADLISARPLGSAYLHVVDFLVPAPLFLSSIFVACLQLIVATVLLAAWTTGVPVRRWGIGRTALVAAAAVVNIHLFPMTPWHTIDGIFLVAVGWYALDIGLRRDRTWVTTLGLLAVGFAAVTKQSFVPAAVVTGLVLIVHRRRDLARLLRDVAALAAVPLAYVLVVAVGGGFGAMVDQLGGGSSAVGQRILDIGAVPDALPVLGVFVVAAAVALLARPVPVRAVAAVVGCGVLGLVVVAGQLERAGAWGIVLWWAAALAVGVHAVAVRRLPTRPVGLLLLAYMASLSWGYDSPTLLGGSLALLAAGLLVRGLPAPSWVRVTGAGAAVVLLAVTAAWMAQLRLADPYRDRPHPELTAGLGASAASMRGIRTTPASAAYLDQIARCVDRHPADRVAVLPDNPFVYPALGVRNPFPIDWPLPAELVADTRERLAATADGLDRDGDYLVLFQTVTDGDLAAGAPVPATVAADAPPVDPTGIAADLRARLSGSPVTCGSFVGVWAPPRG